MCADVAGVTSDARAKGETTRKVASAPSHSDTGASAATAAARAESGPPMLVVVTPIGEATVAAMLCCWALE